MTTPSIPGFTKEQLDWLRSTPPGQARMALATAVPISVQVVQQTTQQEVDKAKLQNDVATATATAQNVAQVLTSQTQAFQAVVVQAKAVGVDTTDLEQAVAVITPTAPTDTAADGSPATTDDGTADPSPTPPAVVPPPDAPTDAAPAEDPSPS